MARKKNDYFEMLTLEAGYAVSAAKYLFETLGDYSYERVHEYKEKMHTIEKDADSMHHKLISCLSAEFITPIDSEDILRLAQITDDITDSLDETVMELYMYCIKDIPAGILDMASLAHRCVDAFYNAVGELKNFKKPQELRSLIIEVNTLEGEADEIYYDAVRSLFDSDTDAKTLIAYKSIYDRLEDCSDLCENAADIIEQIIIKNS